MGRAGRSGTTYSMVCPDEMPFVYDLHLFLGRPVQLATLDHTHGTLNQDELTLGFDVAGCRSVLNINVFISLSSHFTVPVPPFRRFGWRVW